MAKAESTLTARILKALNRLPRTKAIKLHGSAYQEAGTPDILCVSWGVPFLLEVKMPGEKPEPIQRHRMRQWCEAGAGSGVVSSVEEAVDVVTNGVARTTISGGRFRMKKKS